MGILIGQNGGLLYTTKILLLTISFLISSCSLAPFSAGTTGRSYGAGKLQGELGNSNSNYYIKLGFGASKDLDIGYVMEFGGFSTSGIFLKYSFVNNDTGPALAMEVSYGESDTTTFYQLGMISSLAFSKEFEVFINPRINKVESVAEDLELDTSYGNVKVTDVELLYLSMSYGFNIWFSEGAGLSLYGTYIKGDNIETEPEQSFGGSFMFKY